MTNPHDASAPRSTLLTSEDWWAIWLGGLLIALTAAGVITGVAGVGRWTADPTAAFAGRLLPIAVLGIGFALVTAIAARTMGGSFMLHQTGFIDFTIPRLAQMAALRMVEAGKTQLAGVTYGKCLEWWQRLGHEDRIVEVRGLLERLR